jgi:hypothetical protein
MLIDNGVMAGTDILEAVFFLGKAKNYSVFAEWTGDPVGEFKLQVTSKNPGGLIDGKIIPSFESTDWVDLDSAAVSPAGSAGQQLFDVEDASYAWVKAIYTNESGTGVLNVTATKK